jgi:hypothetical protein
MPSSSSLGSSTKRLSSKLPFTVDSIEHYEPFKLLDPAVKDKIRELLSGNVINCKGNIKRPQNPYTLSRQGPLPKLTQQLADSVEGTSESPSATVRNKWKEQKDEQEKYKALAERMKQEHNEKFPGYKFTPISQYKWEAINEEGKKKWFFDSISFISTNILRWVPGTEPRSLDINEWIRDPSHHEYVADEV